VCSRWFGLVLVWTVDYVGRFACWAWLDLSARYCLHRRKFVYWVCECWRGQRRDIERVVDRFCWNMVAVV
jgi:hypothetical protein